MKAAPSLTANQWNRRAAMFVPTVTGAVTTSSSTAREGSRPRRFTTGRAHDPDRGGPTTEGVTMRTTRCTFEGQVYEIPELWLAGQIAAGFSWLVAVQTWHVQMVLADADRG